MTDIERFNIRVYGLLLHAGHVLATEEVIGGEHITKFPGGGLEFGEGPIDCLVREVREEMDVEAQGISHFYTTSFFQRSAFRKNEQVISIYYTFQVPEMMALEMGEVPLGKNSETTLSFRWLPLTDQGSRQISLPIDQVVMDLLIHPAI
ncbi:MAG: NUDIX domain-containing protein [Flavobacteriales bacterium]